MSEAYGLNLYKSFEKNASLSQCEQKASERVSQKRQYIIDKSKRFGRTVALLVETGHDSSIHVREILLDDPRSFDQEARC